MYAPPRKLKNNEWLIHGLSPDNLLMELEPLGWNDMQHLSIKKLWSGSRTTVTCRGSLIAMVLEETIKDGVNRIGPAFGYASGVDEDGKYRGLKLSESFTLYFDDNALIVQPEIAQTQLDAQKPPEPIVQPFNGGPEGGTVIAHPVNEPDAPAPPKPKTRYYGTSKLIQNVPCAI